jgi:hypothetical protein
MVNFYRRFLPGCTRILGPLSDFPKGGTKTLEWTDTAEEAFQNVKWLLVRGGTTHSILSPMLSSPWPLMPPTPMREAFRNKNQEALGVLLVFPPKNRLKQNLVIPLSIRSC